MESEQKDTGDMEEEKSGGPQGDSRGSRTRRRSRNENSTTHYILIFKFFSRFFTKELLPSHFSKSPAESIFSCKSWC